MPHAQTESQIVLNSLSSCIVLDTTKLYRELDISVYSPHVPANYDYYVVGWDNNHVITSHKMTCCHNDYIVKLISIPYS